MKKVAYYILLAISIVNCNGQNKENNLNDKTIMNDSTKNNVYAVDVTALCRYDLFINDIPAVINNNAGGDYFDINDYVLQNGKYKVKVIFYTDPSQNDVIHRTEINLYSYLKKDGEKLGNTKKLQSLPIPNLVFNKPNKIIQEWEVELTDLPYKLEGWENSRVFKEGDSLLVKEKAVAFYEKVRKILNEGKGDEYIKLLGKKNAEVKIFDFNTTENISHSMNNVKGRIIKYALNHMLPIEDYTLKVYAQGRLICLERTGNIKIKSSLLTYRTIKEIQDETNSEKQLDTRGWSPLIYNHYSTLISLDHN